MLTRASEPLRAKIRERLSPSFDPKTSRNRLVMRLISSPEPDRGDMKGGTYLPYKTHPAFDRMAEDVAAILSLNLPDQDSFQYLQPLLGLHLYLYGIETALLARQLGFAANHMRNPRSAERSGPKGGGWLVSPE